MGIHGLNTFMSKRRVFRKYKLRNTKVVIDGNNLMNHLYRECNCNSLFGADNDIFAGHLRSYFTDLLICDVEPLVIFDGGTPAKKEQTIANRYKQKINEVVTFCRNKNLNYDAINSLMKDVFKQVLRELSVCFAQAIFEADENVAAIAKIFNCPVLSRDSDFFIYDVDYIPFDKMRPGLVTDETQAYFKSCSMYKVEYFLAEYPNLDKSTLPLVAALLGNDYSDEGIFADFIDKITPPAYSLNKHIQKISQQKIQLILNWLKNKTLFSAITQILQFIDPKNRKVALEIIQLVYTAYEEIPVDILTALRYPQDSIRDQLAVLQKKSKPHKFIKDLIQQEERGLASCRELAFLEKVPDWFREELYAGLYQGMMVNNFTTQTCSLGAPVQDLTMPCPYTIIFPTMKLMQSLVTKGVCDVRPFKFIDRKVEGNKNEKKLTFFTRTLEGRDIIPYDDLPSLSELRNLPVEERKMIIDKALGLTPRMNLDNLIGPWRLFVGVIVYWLKEDVQPKRNKFHAYAIVFSMLQSLIDAKIGSYRSHQSFDTDYGARYEELMKNLSSEEVMGAEVEDAELTEALKGVTTNDCIIAAKFFITECCVDPRIHDDPQSLNVTLLHVYNMLQNCIREFQNLNSLLGEIYENPSLEKLMRGVLFYNLYNNFKGLGEIDAYVQDVLCDSPSLLRVFWILIGQVKSMCREARVEIFQSFPSPKKRALFYPFGA